MRYCLVFITVVLYLIGVLGAPWPRYIWREYPSKPDRVQLDRYHHRIVEDSTGRFFLYGGRSSRGGDVGTFGLYWYAAGLLDGYR